MLPSVLQLRVPSSHPVDTTIRGFGFHSNCFSGIAGAKIRQDGEHNCRVGGEAKNQADSVPLDVAHEDGARGEQDTE